MPRFSFPAARLALAAVLLAAPAAALEGPDGPGHAEPKRVAVGQPAADFELPDLDGKSVKLSEAKGKIIVLEWFNPLCPYVKSSHTKGTLKGLAARYLAGEEKDVVWFAINSGGPGKQGHAVEDNRKARQAFELGNPILRDESGKVGRLYDVKKTPTIVIIDPTFKVVYHGGEDNATAVKRGEAAEKVCYVDQVIAALRRGEKPPVTTSQPFG